MTAGVAAPAYAGIPVTHRDAACAVAFVTGHEDPDEARVRARLGCAGRVSRDARRVHGGPALEAIAARLIAAGRDPAEPAALIERGTLPDQRVLTGTLETIAAVATPRRRAPAIAVFGRSSRSASPAVEAAAREV